MNCIVCDAQVPQLRVEALADMGKPISCLACSDSLTPKRKAFMVYSHKTAPELQYAEGDEAIRQAERAHHRNR